MKLPEYSWVKDFSGAFTVCDQHGTIIEMNDKAALSFTDEGGRALIGKSVLDCHPEPARSQLKRLMDNHLSNTYTIEKHGVKKLVHQTPWFHAGEYSGFIELSLEIPFEMTHSVRD
jgi:transcriptional regulator with PAS, ATPase and Fis domain